MVIKHSIDNQNIVVLANYRTGSTAFCDIISKETGLLNLDEVFHPSTHERKYGIYSNVPCVIKIMPDHFNHPLIEHLLSTSLIIGLNRKNKIAQITSFYICHMTQRWHYSSDTPIKNYTVDIDKSEVENQVRYINSMNFKFEKLANQYCIERYYYEDVKSQLAESRFVIYQKPDNYNEIYNFVGKILIELGESA